MTLVVYHLRLGDFPSQSITDWQWLQQCIAAETLRKSQLGTSPDARRAESIYQGRLSDACRNRPDK